jgi:CubicO group peptidase (beta-lactamase class C family)
MPMTRKYKELVQKIHSPEFSGAISVSQHNEMIIMDCNGYADRVNELKNNVDTRFAIASGTKLFTALGIMKLVELGKLKLTDKAFQYIPKEFTFYNKDITIKHLLTHTSGLPDYYDEDELKEKISTLKSVPNYDLHKPSDYLAIMPDKEMKFQPGEDFNYNNSAFVFLAIIIEQLTGDYHHWIKTKVLEPAQMTSSGFFKMNQLPQNTAIGYIELENGEYKSNIYELPIIGGGDGGMYTTVKDMDLFWNSLMNGLIVNKDIVKEMMTPQSKSTNMFYGLGVWLEKHNDLYLPLIIGQDPGVSFESGYNPNTKRIHTIISNTESGAWILSEILMKL